MRRLNQLTIGAVGLLGVIGAPLSASAAPASETTCSTIIVRAAYIRANNTNEILGAVQLRRDTCGYRWAWAKMYERNDSTLITQAYISRWEGNVRQAIFTCDSPGGIGHIGTNETECRTPKIRKVTSTTTFIASARHNWFHETAWSCIGKGQTVRG